MTSQAHFDYKVSAFSCKTINIEFKQSEMNAMRHPRYPTNHESKSRCKGLCNVILSDRQLWSHVVTKALL